MVAASSDGARPDAAGGLVVDVAGAVRDPGVYRMPAGARIHEAIEAAGGLATDADPGALNRAARVVDGQQVLVPVAGSAPAGSEASAGARVSINAADATQLQQLPGIGPVTAAKIVAERDSGGPYASIDDLQRVPGVGPATIESVRDAATT
jgi:competence protein ComEA